jgi:asparagine N-glycosylation enzyme membrane subunit Stt3
MVGLFVFFFLGEGPGDWAGYIGAGFYCLIAQYFLSRGHPQALRSDWPLILHLNFMVLLIAVICLTFAPGAGGKLPALGLAAVTLACSYAGAALAALIARTRTPAV